MAYPHVYDQVVEKARYAAIGVVSSAHHFRWRIASLILISSTIKVLACFRCTTTQVRKSWTNPIPARAEQSWLTKRAERIPLRMLISTKRLKLYHSALATLWYLINVWIMY